MPSPRPFNPEYFLNMVDVEEEMEMSDPSTITSLESTDLDYDVKEVRDPELQNALYAMYEESLQPDFREKLAQEALQFIIRHGLSE